MKTKITILAILLCACAPTGRGDGVGDQYGRPYIDIVVESYSWDAKQVDVLCNGSVIDAVYGVTNMERVKSRTYLRQECQRIQFAVIIRRGSPYGHVTESIPISSGDKILFIINTYLPLSTFQFIYREDHNEN